MLDILLMMLSFSNISLAYRKQNRYQWDRIFFNDQKDDNYLPVLHLSNSSETKFIQIEISDYRGFIFYLDLETNNVYRVSVRCWINQEVLILCDDDNHVVHIGGIELGQPYIKAYYQ